MDWRRLLHGDFVPVQKRPEYRKFLNEQRRIWSPSKIFKKCCVRWLADGDYRDINTGNYSARSGCLGMCTFHHPTITLSYDEKEHQGQTVSRISHSLNPFLTYFKTRCAEGTATKKDEHTYILEGHIRENITAIKEHNGFGAHLITCSPEALIASDKAHWEELENEKDCKPPAAKRSKTIKSVAPWDELIEAAMDVCRQERLMEDLDVLDIYSLQQTTKAMCRVAERMAAERMQQVSIACGVLTDGKRSTKVPFQDLLDDSREIPVGSQNEGDDEDNPIFAVYDVSENRLEMTKVGDWWIPDFVHDYVWDSGQLFKFINDGKPRRHQLGEYDNDYRGNLVRIYLEPIDKTHEVDRGVFQQRHKIGEFQFGSLNSPVKTGSCMFKDNFLLQYDILSADRTETNSTENKSKDKGDDSGKEQILLRTKGRFTICRAQVSFVMLVHIHVRHILRQLQYDLRQFIENRRMTKEDYTKLCRLENLARDLPERCRRCFQNARTTK